MRLTLDPLAAAGDAVPVAGGSEAVALWQARLAWNCRGTPLDLRILAPEALPLPAAEPSEPVAGAIARCVQVFAGSGALLLLANPAVALGPARIAFAQGVRLFAIATAADEATWDAALALGQPVYGVRGTVVAEVLRPRPANLLSALAFGAFHCAEGLDCRIEDSPRGVVWTCDRAVAASVLGKGGFEVAHHDGPAGSYQDRGNECVVRVVLRTDDGGACWTQPRFIGPVSPEAGHACR
jgi:hypothetical protein